MKILKADREAYVANISCLLLHIGYETSPDGTDHLVNTKLGAIHFWLPPYNSDLYYRLNGEPEHRPTDNPIFHLLKDDYNTGLNWFFFSRKEADLACLRSWEVAYESMARKLCHLINGHIVTSKAIAAKGTLEELLPSEGHVLMGTKKMTVAAFRKRYETALGNQGTLFFDRRIELDNVPYSPFKGETLTVVAKQPSHLPSKKWRNVESKTTVE